MNTVAMEKEMAMLRYRRVRRLATLLRYLEISAFVVLLSWSSFHLPAAARISGELLRRLATLLLSPRCVFLIGNAIVIALVYNSGNFSCPLFASSESPSTSPPSAGDASEVAAGFYEEFLETRNRLSHALPAPEPEAKAEIVFEDKAVCVEKRRVCRRSRSERMERPKKALTPELRRSLTDVGKKADKKPPQAEAAATKAEEADPEEFRRTIEAFIAKQTKFHREESMVIVCVDGGARNLLCSAGSPELTISRPNDANEIEVSV